MGKNVLLTTLKNCFDKAGFVKESPEEDQEATVDEEHTDTENTKEAWKQLESLGKAIRKY